MYVCLQWYTVAISLDASIYFSAIQRELLRRNEQVLPIWSVFRSLFRWRSFDRWNTCRCIGSVERKNDKLVVWTNLTVVVLIVPFVCHLLFLLNRLGFYLSMQCTRPTGAIFHPREWTMPTKINYATSFWTVLCYSIMYPRSSCNNLRHVTCNLQRKEVSSLKLTKNTQTDSNYVASIKWPFNCNTIFTVSSMLLA